MIRSIILASFVIFFMILLISFPDQALHGSIRGLNMWFEIVFPSLLPFFVLAELFIAFGVVHFFGTLLEPFMRPIFNVPGSGSFALIIGMASGYPVGAKICVRLREEKELTQIEAERLIAFTNAASPLFIFGAISVGFFHNPKVGLLIALCHYVSNMIVGIFMRFYGMDEQTKKSQQITDHFHGKVLHRALKNMHNARRKDGRVIGKLLGDALLSSIQTLVVVGGFIIIFSVLNELIFTIGIAAIISSIFNIFLIAFHLPTELNIPLLAGLFEITSGVEKVSQVTNSELLAQLIIVSFILGFNGFSVQAQVASLMTTTDIRFKPYFFARIIHGFIGALLTVLFYRLFFEKDQSIGDQTIETFHQATHLYSSKILCILHKYGPLITLLTLTVGIIIYSLNMLQKNN
ncbi:MAG TPA: sporulation integral membrane protein YlbJ [Bacillota bacterium]|nr:sporulation integral membrane protein YlbJ [Bacillota bacterium]